MKTSDGIEIGGPLGGPEINYKIIRLLGEAWGARPELVRRQSAQKLLKKYARLPQGRAALRELAHAPDPGVRKIAEKGR